MAKKIRNVLCIGILLLSLSSILTGCNLEIPFNKLILTNNENNVIEDININGIELSKNLTNSANILRFQNVADTIFNQLGDKDFYYNYYNNPRHYNYGLENYLTASFYKSLISGDTKNDFKKVIDDIYADEYALFKKANVIKVGQDINNYFYDIEIVSVNDELTFNTEIIRFYTNKNFRITSTKIIKEFLKVDDTTNPLTSESLIPESHTEILNTFKTFLEQMENKALFESISSSSNISYTDIQLESLISNISLSNKDVDTLKNLFLMGKGNFNNKVLISYEMDDEDKMATSIYTYSFSKGETIENFVFYYSRVTQKLTKIVQEKNKQ